MSRQQITRRLQALLTWTGRRAAAAIVALGAVVVVVVIAALTLGSGLTGGDDSASRTSGESAGFDGAVAPSGGAALRAPEESSGSMAGAPAFDDEKGGVAQSATDSVGVGVTGGTGLPLPSADAGRTIIRSGSVDIEVAAVADAFEQIRQLATALGGYVGDSTFSGSGEHQTAYLTIRVPSERFGDAITQIRALAVEVQTISTSAHDVTEEYSDIEAMLRNLRAVEQQYVELLGRASSIGDILQVQDRLNQVRLEIDRLEGRRQLLAAQSELATIAISLRPVGSGPSLIDETRGPLEAASAAWQASLETLAALATVVLVAAVYSWWIVPPAIILIVIARRLWRRRMPATATVVSD